MKDTSIFIIFIYSENNDMWILIFGGEMWAVIEESNESAKTSSSSPSGLSTFFKKEKKKKDI